MSSTVTGPAGGTGTGGSAGAVPEAWVRLLSVHAQVTREMDAHLRAAHGLTLNDYEVLLFLSWAPQLRMRPVDLARGVLLTQGGVTRLLDGLERAGLVKRARCETDGRVVFACLTTAGRRTLRDAATTHLSDVQSLFAIHFTEDELTVLAGLLGRLPGGRAGAGLRHPVR